MPQFVNWLQSDNKSVIVFGLWLARMFNQYSAGNDIVKLITHQDNTISQVAAEVAAALYLPQAVPQLLHKLENTDDYNLKSTLIQALGKIGSYKELKVLKNIFKGDKQSLSLKAAYAILAIDKAQEQWLAEASTGAKHQALLAHANDKRINEI